MVESEFISIGCNRVPGTLCVSQFDAHGLCAYGGNRSVALSYPFITGKQLSLSYRNVFRTLNGHTGRVNQVQFIEIPPIHTIPTLFNAQKCPIGSPIWGIVSGCSQGELRIWTSSPSSNTTKFTEFSHPFLEHINCSLSKKLYTCSIELIQVLPLPETIRPYHQLSHACDIGSILSNLLFTASSDGQIDIFLLNILRPSQGISLFEMNALSSQCELVHLQSWKIGDEIATSASLVILDLLNTVYIKEHQTSLGTQSDSNHAFHGILAVAATDQQIHLYDFILDFDPSVRNDNDTTHQFTMEKRSYTLKGHESWIRTLAFHLESDTIQQSSENSNSTTTNPLYSKKLILASGSQDKYIRIWSIPQISPNWNSPNNRIFHNNHGSMPALDSLLIGHDGWIYDLHFIIPHKFINMNDNPASIQNFKGLLSCSSDGSILLWTYDFKYQQWMTLTQLGGHLNDSFGFYGVDFKFESINQLSIIPSTCMDTSNINSDFSFLSLKILAHSHSGSLSLYSCNLKVSNDGIWECDYSKSLGCISGHFGPVNHVTFRKNINADLKENFNNSDTMDSLLMATCSDDRTTRLYTCISDIAHQEYIHKSKYDHDSISSKYIWKEIGRPQLHGYEIQQVIFSPSNAYRLISLATEKVIRIFEGTKQFISLFGHIHGWGSEKIKKQQDKVSTWYSDVPTLGLSNKVISDPLSQRHDVLPFTEKQTVSYDNDENTEFFQSGHSVFREFPLLDEDHLHRLSLWPEQNKWYGHLFDPSTLVHHPTLHYVFSSTLSIQPEFSFIYIWNELSGKLQPKLPECVDFMDDNPCSINQQHSPRSIHQLTITGLVCTNDGRFLMAVSRDRSLSIYHLQETKYSKNFLTGEKEKNTMLIHTCTEHFKEAHSRMIYCVDVASLHFEIFKNETTKYYCVATGSRDKSCKLWIFAGTDISKNDKADTQHNLTLGCTLKFEAAVTAVHILPVKSRSKQRNKGNMVIIIGLENGHMCHTTFEYTENENRPSIRIVSSEKWDPMLLPCDRITAIDSIICNNGGDNLNLILNENCKEKIKNDINPIGENVKEMDVSEDPRYGHNDSWKGHLAVSSTDHSTRIFKFEFSI